ncbi:ATP synthase F1 subunit gamma [Rhodohalobacter sp. 614A]|uniref:ATP synthase F1 subunit gamma n=1 Tax=Rhodohalobacter sp. 614A TaxID=2908649 RepID=UPI001F2E5929|nr:ATP synthase F1 subunit gamma [Rhodohalobacter sp. 614A]
MANLRDIRNRISSIQNTQQITKAMKMVAAAKLRKAQQRMTETRPYSKKMGEVVSRLVSAQQEIQNDLLRKPEEIRKVLLIVVGSDRGLCGGFNNNLFRKVESTISDQYAGFHKNGDLDVITIGKKASGYFKKRNYNVVQSYPGFFDNLNYEETSAIMKYATDNFVEENYDKVLIAFNEFKTVISQNRLVDEVLPLQTDFIEDTDQSSSETDYIYEPDPESILDKLLPVHLNMQLWRAVLESNASEQGARMAAMDNATENAKELEQDLKLEYNQARQSAITTEISEIVSGAAALEDN